MFNEYYPRLQYFAERLKVSHEDAEDIVANAFTKFWMSRLNFDNLNKIKSFLYTNTRKAALNVLRQQKLHSTKELTDFDDAPSENTMELEAIRAEMLGILFEQIERLPDKGRQVILLTYREGLNTHQVAEKLGISVSNVTSQRSRAIFLLKIALAEQYSALFPLLLTQLLSTCFCQFG